MKKYTTTLLLLAGLLLGGCAQQNTPAAPAAAPEPAAPVISSVAAPDYFFIDNLLLGSCSADGWHSVGAVSEISAYAESTTTAPAATFAARDIAGADSYHLYTMDEFIGTTKEIIWPLDTGRPGTFDIDNSGTFTTEMQAALKALALPVTDTLTNTVYDDLGRITLPADFADSPLAELQMPGYAARSYFSMNDTLDMRTPIRLATSAKHNPLPHKVQVLYQLPKELEQILANELTALGIGDAPVNLTNYYASDFDHDGQDESLILIQTPTNKSGYPILSDAELSGASGVYSLLYYQDDVKTDPAQSLQPLFGWVNAYTPEALATVKAEQKRLNLDVAEITDPAYCRRLIFLGAFDLNGDGTLEFCVEDAQWEGSTIRTYALDENNSYHTILTSSTGL